MEMEYIYIGMMIDRDVAEIKERKQGRDVKLLSFKHTLANGHIIQCPIQRPYPATTPTAHTH